MSNDLQNQLRAIVDAAPPVSADEAITRAEAFSSALSVDVRARRRLLRPMAIAASAVALAGGGIGFGIAANSHAPTITRGPVPPQSLKHEPKMILTAAEVRAIILHSSAATESSGTAEVTQTSTQDGIAQNGYDTAVTFSGQNIDEKITSVPEPPGSTKSFSTDDRFVDGQFYIYTPGPGTGDVSEWLHDTNSANDASSMQFPDPRTLYEALDPQAQFTVEGTTTLNGRTVTHLVAGDPSAINTAPLDNLAADAHLTSFEIWVDTNDVVQQIMLATSETNQVCQFAPLSKAELQKLAKKYGTRLPDGKVGVEIPAPAMKAAQHGKHCGPQTTTSDTTVSFADLGVPQSVTAPTNPVDYAGKG